MSKMSEKAIDKLNELDDQGKITIYHTPTGKNWLYDHYKKNLEAADGHADAILSIAAGVDWIPMDANETPPITCFHTWRTVTLFTSIVEECSKCGALRE